MENLIAHGIGLAGLLYMAVGFGIILIDCIEDVIITRRRKKNV
jgi:hypothetical protein